MDGHLIRKPHRAHPAPHLCIPAAGALVVLVSLVFAAGSPSAADPLKPAEVMRAYVDAVTAGAGDRAESLWVPHAPAMARRLGIRYRDVAAKYDCASPLYRLRDGMRDGSVRITVRSPVPRASYLEVPLHIATAVEESVTPYYIVPFGDGWRLASRLDVLTRAWPVIDTRFMAVHCRDSTLLNAYALGAADMYVDSVGHLLGVSDKRMALLAEKKIDYFLGRPPEVEQLTGFATPGLTDLPADAVISSHLPHYHELVHLLVNFALEDVGLYVLPCLQEGLAVCWGGRWGKSPAVMRQLGAFVMANELATIDDVLTYQGFHGSGLPPDLGYAVSGILVQSLVETMGIDQFLRLYGRFSGSAAAVVAVTADSVRQAVQEITGAPWSDVVARCHAIASACASSGLDPGGRVAPDAVPLPAAAGSLAGTVSHIDSAHVFEVTAPGAAPTGAILFGPAADPASEYQSRLFAQHLPGETYRGEHLGLVFDSLEVGLYDYRTDNLLAKFAAGFSSGPGIYDPDARSVRFSVSRLLLPDPLWQGAVLLIPR